MDAVWFVALHARLGVVKRGNEGAYGHNRDDGCLALLGEWSRFCGHA
jgi:hypothetical protein